MKTVFKAAEAVASALLAVVFVIFVTAVFMRYIMHMPLSWADELSVILFSILIFFSSGVVLRYSEQVRFEVVYDLLPAKVARIVTVVSLIAFGLIFLAAVWPCLDYAMFMMRQRTPALNLPFFYVFVSFPFFLLTAGLQMIWSGVRVALGRAQPE